VLGDAENVGVPGIADRDTEEGRGGGARARSSGSVGDWPCLAEMMMAVRPARPSAWIRETIAPTWVSM
jgi:hypothetical protein